MDTTERARIAAEVEYELLRGKAFEKRSLHSAFWVSGAAHMASKHLKLHEKSMEYMQHILGFLQSVESHCQDPRYAAEASKLRQETFAHLSTLRAEIEPPTTTK